MEGDEACKVVKNTNFFPDLRKGQVFDSVRIPNDDEGRGEIKENSHPIKKIK
jgi:hypothetical protein